MLARSGSYLIAKMSNWRHYCKGEIKSLKKSEQPPAWVRSAKPNGLYFAREDAWLKHCEETMGIGTVNDFFYEVSAMELYLQNLAVFSEQHMEDRKHWRDFLMDHDGMFLSQTLIDRAKAMVVLGDMSCAWLAAMDIETVVIWNPTELQLGTIRDTQEEEEDEEEEEDKSNPWLQFLKTGDKEASKRYGSSFLGSQQESDFQSDWFRTRRKMLGSIERDGTRLGEFEEAFGPVPDDFVPTEQELDMLAMTPDQLTKEENEAQCDLLWNAYQSRPRPVNGPIGTRDISNTTLGKLIYSETRR